MPTDTITPERLEILARNPILAMIGEVEALAREALARRSTPVVTDDVENSYQIISDILSETGLSDTDHDIVSGALDALYDAALSASPSPAEPSADFWQRIDDDLLAEWTDDCSAGAAARRVCRVLGIAGKLPTLKRLLEEMLADANRASADRTRILSEFDAAAPAASAAARYHSYARNNPHLRQSAEPGAPSAEPSAQTDDSGRADGEMVTVRVPLIVDDRGDYCVPSFAPATGFATEGNWLRATLALRLDGPRANERYGRHILRAQVPRPVSPRITEARATVESVEGE